MPMTPSIHGVTGTSPLRSNFARHGRTMTSAKPMQAPADTKKTPSKLKR